MFLVTKHPFAKYTDLTELAYHLHYEHGMPLAQAMSLSDEDLVAGHSDAHA